MTIVDPASSSSSWTAIIPVIGTLAGVVAGFLANEVSHLIRTKREDRNVLGRTLADLLEIRHHLRAIPEVIGLVRSRFPAALPTEVNFGLRQILRAFLPDAATLSKRFDEAVSAVAGPFPLLAFEFRHYGRIEKRFPTLRCVRLIFWRPRSLSYRIDQFGRADLQRSGNLNDIVKREVPLPAFNLGDVVAMNISTTSQLFLADLPLLPQYSDSLPKLNKDIPHPHIVRHMLTIGL